MADLPLSIDGALGARLLAALDAERKIVRGLDALGPIVDRDVLVVGGGQLRAAQLAAAGARVQVVAPQAGGALPVESGSVDAVLGFWDAFRGVDPAEVAEADRVLRPTGRLLVVHDYGRDDVSRVRGDLPEYGTWSRRDGEFLRAGFRIRVLHCWWTFDDLDAAADFLAAAFGPEASAVSASLRRPRLSYNVAIYHRTRPGATEGAGPAQAAVAAPAAPREV